MEIRMKGCPPIYCPDCKSRLMNAGDRAVKNGTRTEIVTNSLSSYEYIIRCHKCGSYIGIIKEPSSHR